MGLRYNVRILAIPANNRLGSKMTVGDTLAYYERATIMAVKMFYSTCPS